MKQNIIEGQIKLSGLTVDSFVKMMGWSRSTYQRRIKRPGTITLTEFERMDGLVHFPDKVKALKDLTR